MDLEKRVEVLEKKVAELERKVQAQLDFKEITMESNIKTPYKMLKACDIEELQRDALKKHKRNTANTISELTDRVVRLEKKKLNPILKFK